MACETKPKELMRLCKAIYRNSVRRSSRTWVVTVLRPLYGPFEKMLPWIPTHSTLLDIGCGKGAFVFLAKQLRQLKAVVAYDVHAPSIALAETVNSDQDITFTCHNIPSVDDIRSATVITLVDVLHHMIPSQQTELLTHLFTHIQPGTRLLIKDLDPKPRWRALANRLTDAISTRSHVHYLSQETLSNTLLQHGFTIPHQARLLKHVWSHYLIVADYPAH